MYLSAVVAIGRLWTLLITCFSLGLTDVTVGLSADVDAVDTSHFRTLGGSENVFCIIFLNIYVE